MQPSVATNEAGLGSMTEVIDVIMQADVLKPAMHAAREVGAQCGCAYGFVFVFVFVFVCVCVCECQGGGGGF